MSPGLADRLNAERRRKFVGRVAERDLFRSVLFVLGEAAVAGRVYRHSHDSVMREGEQGLRRYCASRAGV